MPTGKPALNQIHVKPVLQIDRKWVAEFVNRHWGSDIVVGKGRIHRPANLKGFMAFNVEKLTGLITYHVDGDECEIVTLNSTEEGAGIGTALIIALRERARADGCKKLWLITTNDNLNALRFYQKRGFQLVALYPNAVEASRKLKPQIPAVAENGIHIRDELESELKL